LNANLAPSSEDVRSLGLPYIFPRVAPQQDGDSQLNKKIRTFDGLRAILCPFANYLSAVAREGIGWLFTGRYPVFPHPLRWQQSLPGCWRRLCHTVLIWCTIRSRMCSSLHGGKGFFARSLLRGTHCDGPLYPLGGSPVTLLLFTSPVCRLSHFGTSGAKGAHAAIMMLPSSHLIPG